METATVGGSARFGGPGGLGFGVEGFPLLCFHYATTAMVVESIPLLARDTYQVHNGLIRRQ